MEKVNINTDEELVEFLNDALEMSGYKKKHIANELGIKSQNLKRYLSSATNLDKANEVLSLIGLHANINISEKNGKKSTACSSDTVTKEDNYEKLKEKASTNLKRQK